MHENHQNEQYFFQKETINYLADLLEKFDNPCCICTPTVGEELVRRGKNVAILDIDERFSHLKGFQHYDLYRPEWINKKFDIILCDPPFFNVSFSQLFKALRMLSHHDYQQKMMVTYLKRRRSSLEGTFGLFDLKMTDYQLKYVTVQPTEKNDIRLFEN